MPMKKDHHLGTGEAAGRRRPCDKDRAVWEGRAPTGYLCFVSTPRAPRAGVFPPTRDRSHRETAERDPACHAGPGRFRCLLGSAGALPWGSPWLALHLDPASSSCLEVSLKTALTTCPLEDFGEVCSPARFLTPRLFFHHKFEQL